MPQINNELALELLKKALSDMYYMSNDVFSIYSKMYEYQLERGYYDENYSDFNPRDIVASDLSGGTVLCSLDKVSEELASAVLLSFEEFGGDIQGLLDDETECDFETVLYVDYETKKFIVRK